MAGRKSLFFRQSPEVDRMPVRVQKEDFDAGVEIISDERGVRIAREEAD